MRPNKRHSSSQQNSESAHRRLPAEPNAKEIICLQLEELKRRPSARKSKQFVRLLYSFLAVAILSRIGQGSRGASRRRTPIPRMRATRFAAIAARRLGAVTLSTGLMFTLWVTLDILSPLSTRSGSDDRELRLGALLLPAGQEDTLSDDDGWETPDPIRFPEPPPSDFEDIPLPSAESYTFEPSPEFLGGESEESLSYLEQLFGQLERPQEHLELPSLPSLDSKSDQDKLPTPQPSLRVPSEAVPKRDSETSDESTVASHIVSRGDTLWGICRKYNVKHRDVIAYNNLRNPSFLRVGRELLLPGVRASSDNAPLRFPLDEIQISSGYGTRIHPILRRRLFHRGIDLRAKRGTPVYAAAEGKVIFAHRSGLKGKTIAIMHENGMKTVYAHLQSILVKIGERVAAGQVIAKSGATGRVTAPHLHFEVWKGRQHTNPLTALPPLPRSRVYSRHR